MCAIAFAYCSCTKEHLTAQKTAYNISIKAITSDAAATTNPAWQQIIGGSATITFDAKFQTDTMAVSSITNTIDLANLASYNWKLFPGKYDIALTTTGDAAVSPFVRFNASGVGVPINADGVIGMVVFATDGVITIKRSYLDTTVTPTFAPTGAAAADLYNANGYAYLYVKGGTSGKLNFTSSEGDLYKADITVTAKEQSDVSPKTNAKGRLVIQSYPFNSKSKVQ